MLHEILTLDRPLIIFDLETTGVVEGSRIVEIGFQLFTREGLTKEWGSYVNPEIPIPPETTAVHGITDDLVKDAPTFHTLAPNLVLGFNNCDYGGKNVRFDLRIFESEMKRVGVQWHYRDAKVLDAERLEQLAVPRTLSHLYEKYTGKKHEGAHRAVDDVRASTEVLFHQLRVHSAVLPANLTDLHELQWPGRIDTEGKFIIREGAVYCTFGKYRNLKIQAIPPDYWRFILKSDFSSEIKDIANNALKGVYPEVR